MDGLSFQDQLAIAAAIVALALIYALLARITRVRRYNQLAELDDTRCERVKNDSIAAARARLAVVPTHHQSVEAITMHGGYHIPDDFADLEIRERHIRIRRNR